MGLGKLLSRGGRPADQLDRSIQPGAFQVLIDGNTVNYPTSIYRGGMALPGAWRAALLISDLLGSIPWDAYTDATELVPMAKVSPRPALLEQPSPPDNRMTTFSSWALDLLWHGNAIGLIADRDSDGYPTAVLAIPAEQVGIRRWGWPAMTGLPNGPVEYMIGGEPYGPYDVVHIKGPCKPSDPRGFGILEAHLSQLSGENTGTLDIAHELQRQARSISGHAIPSGVLKSSNPDATVESLQAAKAAWLAAQRDRTVAVLNASLEFAPLAWNPSETQLIEARKMSLHETALLFGLSPAQLGVETLNRHYKNDNAEDVALVKWGLRGHLARFEHALSAAFPPGMSVMANLDDILRADQLTRYSAHQIALSAGWMTVEEVREVEGLPELPEGTLAPKPAVAPATDVPPTDAAPTDTAPPAGEPNLEELP